MYILLQLAFFILHGFVRFAFVDGHFWCDLAFHCVIKPQFIHLSTLERLVFLVSGEAYHE